MSNNSIQNVTAVFCLIISSSLLTNAYKIESHLGENIYPAI